MKMLTRLQQSYIEKQMYNKARDIDVAIYNSFLDENEKELIIDGLLFYMNSDGGIGNGLYIDNYNTNSSVYQVYEALRILDIANIDSSCTHELYDHLINKMMNYLYNRCEIINNKWNPNVLSTKDFAHNQIFEYNLDNTKLFDYHPTAAILGYTVLLCKPTKVYYKKAMQMINVMLKDFYAAEALTKMDFIAFNSFLNSIKKANLFLEDQRKIEDKLVKLALENVSIDFENENVLHPLEAGLYLNNQELKEKIDLQLDYIIDHIAIHGLWEHKGSWGNKKYPEEDSAKMKWIGAESVNNYFYLQKFERIEK